LASLLCSILPCGTLAIRPSKQRFFWLCLECRVRGHTPNKPECATLHCSSALECWLYHQPWSNLLSFQGVPHARVYSRLEMLCLRSYSCIPLVSAHLTRSIQMLISVIDRHTIPTPQSKFRGNSYISATFLHSMTPWKWVLRHLHRQLCSCGNTRRDAMHRSTHMLQISSDSVVCIWFSLLSLYFNFLSFRIHQQHSHIKFCNTKIRPPQSRLFSRKSSYSFNPSSAFLTSTTLWDMGDTWRYLLAASPHSTPRKRCYPIFHKIIVSAPYLSNSTVPNSLQEEPQTSSFWIHPVPILDIETSQWQSQHAEYVHLHWPETVNDINIKSRHWQLAPCSKSSIIVRFTYLYATRWGSNELHSEKPNTNRHHYFSKAKKTKQCMTFQWRPIWSFKNNKHASCNANARLHHRPV